MINNTLKFSVLALSVSAVLSACGGGGGGDSTTSSTDVISAGTIDGFGSVIVNGVRYATTSARVVRDDGSLIDDNPSNDDLKAIVGEGNIVKVRGTRSDDSNGVADVITIDDELVGAVSNINNDNLTFEVDGQLISVTPATIIDDSIIGSVDDTAYGDIDPAPTLGSLLAGLTVEVSGFPTATGLEATRIEDVDTSTTSTLSGTPGFINLIDDDFDDGEVEIEGTITAVDTLNSTITINTVVIPVDDVTLFSEGMHLEIKAIYVNDTLQVTRIEDEAEDTVRIDVMADAEPSLVNGKMTITNLLGLNIVPTDRTRLEDDTDTLPEGFTLTEFLALIDNNTHIEARGYPLNDDILWTEIEISYDAEARCRLRGPVEAYSKLDAEITIEGVVVDLTGSQFEGTNDLPITSDAFFQALDENPNAVVQATSEDFGCTLGNLDAKEVSLEAEDDVLVGDDNNGDDINDNELVGTVIVTSDTSFDISGESITVVDTTLIDDSIVELVRGVELTADVAFSDLLPGETLDTLLQDGTTYVVQVDRSGDSPVAISIEDL